MIGFTNPTLSVKFHNDGQNFDLLEELGFVSAVWGEIRTMTASDGLSVPRIFENIVERFGKYLFCGILHDAAFRNKLEQLREDGLWHSLEMTEHQANNLIDEALSSRGCPWIERKLIFANLEAFGWLAFNQDRKENP